MKKNNSKLAKRLSQYGSFALAAMGASEVDGQVIYTDVNPDFVGGMGSTYAIDFDNDGVDDVIIENNTYSFYSYVFPRVYANPQGTNAVLGSLGGGVFAYPYALNSGNMISSGAPGYFLDNYYLNSMNYNNSFGNWLGVTDKYLGVQFNISGSTHYGWIRLDVTSSGDFIVKDFAYESTPGTGILAGAMPITCPDPSGLATNNETENSADITWTAGGSETEWEIEYGTTGFSPGSGTTVVDNDGTLGESLTGLTANTTYDVYVTAICGPADESGQTGPETFTTLPLGVENQSFEGFSFYPNPVQNKLNMNAQRNIGQVEIYDLLGKKVLSIQPGQMDHQIELSSLRSGTYLMKITIGKNSKVFKLIKK